MSKENARAEYERLDPNVQEGLKHFFGEADYMKEPPDFDYVQEQTMLLN